MEWLTVILAVGGVFLFGVPLAFSQEKGRVPPLIDLEPSKQVNYRLGYNVRLPCRASGTPPPTYTWFFNNEKLEVSADGTISVMPDDGTLVIGEGRKANEGEYQCKAENPLGTAITVRTFLRPAILEAFEPRNTQRVYPRLGAPLRIKCSPPKNYPNPTTYWAVEYVDKTGEFIDQTDRIVIDEEGGLNFLNVAASDGLLSQTGSRGRYGCKSFNPVLRKFVTGDYHEIYPQGEHITNYDPAFLWKSPSTVIAKKGEAKSLFCIVGGHPSPEVNWARADGELPNGRYRLDKYGMELVLTDVQEEDEGTYTCDGLLGVESADATFHLTVESVPSWIQKPENVMTSPGEEAVFFCDGYGKPSPDVFWYIDGERAAQDTKRAGVTIQDNMLTVQVTSESSMVVQCNVTNKHGYVFTNAYLNVQQEPPRLERTPPLSLLTAEGLTVHLDCHAYGSPKPQMIWTYGSGEEMTGGRFFVASNGTLIITRVTLPDAGKYTCHAVNKFGTSAYASTTLAVRRKTQLRTVPEDLIIWRGQEGRFSCSATTDPEEVENLRITWLKDGHSVGVEESQRLYLNTFDESLIISSSMPLDTGTYTCVASNGLDSVSASAQLTVEGWPEALKPIEVQCQRAVNYPDDQNRAKLMWTSSGSNNAPVLEHLVQTRYREDLKWVDAAVTSGTEVTVTLDLLPGGNYTFRVLARNRVGWSLPSAVFRQFCLFFPQVPPRNPANVATWNSQEKGLYIRWTAMSVEEQYGPDFYYSVAYRKIEAQEEDKPWQGPFKITDWKTSEYKASVPSSFARYRIQVWASNQLGDAVGGPTEIIGFSGEDDPTVTVQNFRRDLDLTPEGSARSVSFAWDLVTPSAANIQGFMKGFRIELRDPNDEYSRLYPLRIVDVDLEQDQYERLQEILRAGEEPVPMAAASGLVVGVPLGRRRRQADNITTTAAPGNEVYIPTSATIHNLPAYKELTAIIRVRNTDYLGLDSGVIAFTTGEGPPGPVRLMTVQLRAPNMLQVTWLPPDEPSGVISGYHFSVQMIDGLRLGAEERVPQAASPLQREFRLTGLMSEQLYRVYIRASTARGGYGEPYFLDVRTTPATPPGAATFGIFDVTKRSFLVVYEPNPHGNPGSAFFCEYRIKNTGPWQSSAPEMTSRSINVTGLTQGMTYEVRLVSSNGNIMQQTSSEVQEVTLTGTAATRVFEGHTWFVALILMILLVIAMVIAIIFGRRRMKTVAQKREERLRMYRSGSLHHGEHGVLNPHAENLAGTGSIPSRSTEAAVEKQRASELGSVSVAGSRTMTSSGEQPTYPLYPPQGPPRTRGGDAPPTYAASTTPRGYSQSSKDPSVPPSAQGSRDLPVYRGSQSTMQSSRGALNPAGSGRVAGPAPVYGSVSGMAQATPSTQGPRGPRYATGAPEEPQAYPSYRQPSQGAPAHYSTSQSSMPRYVSAEDKSSLPRYTSRAPRYTGSQGDLTDGPPRASPRMGSQPSIPGVYSRSFDDDATDV